MGNKYKDRLDYIEKLAKNAGKSYIEWLDRKDLLHEPTYDNFLRSMDKLCLFVLEDKPKGAIPRGDRS